MEEELKYKLISDFKLLESSLNGEAKSPFHKIRQDAISVFEELGFPVKKLEEWKYTNLSNITKNRFRQFLIPEKINLTFEEVAGFIYPEFEGNIIVLINGHYSVKFSKIVTQKDGVFIGSFSEAREKHNDLIQNYFAKYADYYRNSLTALNTAFAIDGVFIHLEKNVTVDEPLLILNIADSREENLIAQPRNLFILEEGSSILMADDYYTIGDHPFFTNSVTEIILKQNASLEHYKIQNDGSNAYHIGTIQVEQERDSRFSNTTISWGGGLIRNNLNATLNGENSESHFFGLYLLKDKQFVDNHTLVDHAVPNCNSNELYKGLIDDKATGVFNGKIMVRKDAQKTNAYQSNKNILLSENAKINAKPQLEIFADDVKCSHGATSGQLDENSMFYLQSRGISKVEAKILLMNAFSSEVIDSVKIDSLRQHLHNLILKKLGK
ncbi:MAG TPA: Fe-S cluster assembly protein SufD [Ignavibacteria bacterium]|nr:Fe-S cluster assembly protein SufD [Ignavibacteria bacterium]